MLVRQTLISRLADAWRLILGQADSIAIAENATTDTKDFQKVTMLSTELENYQHAFETTAIDRDLWKKRYLWLEWNVTNPLQSNPDVSIEDLANSGSS